jgi:hypothetical protein
MHGRNPIRTRGLSVRQITVGTNGTERPGGRHIPDIENMKVVAPIVTMPPTLLANEWIRMS